MKTAEHWVKKFADRHGPHVVHYEILPALIEAIQRDAWKAAREAQVMADDLTVRMNTGECPELPYVPFPTEVE